MHPILMSEITDSLDKLRTSYADCLSIDLKFHYREKRENKRTGTSLGHLISASAALGYPADEMITQADPNATFEDTCLHNYKQLDILLVKVTQYLVKEINSIRDNDAVLSLKYLKLALAALRD